MSFKESIQLSPEDYKTLDVSDLRDDQQQEEYARTPEHPKWETILFVGDYDPITITEYKRITDFILGYVNENSQDFDDSVKLALMTDIKPEKRFSLSNEEVNFLTSKLYGLKTYFIDYSGLTNLLTTSDTKEEINSLDNEMLNLLNDIKASFLDDNVLFVLSSTDDKTLTQEIQKFSHGETTYGYITYDVDEDYYGDNMDRIDINSDVIKAVVLLDDVRPDPEHIKFFANKIGMADKEDMVRKINFKADNEFYLDMFKKIFPALTTSRNIDDTTLNSNYQVIMDILKQMYNK